MGKRRRKPRRDEFGFVWSSTIKQEYNLPNHTEYHNYVVKKTSRRRD